MENKMNKGFKCRLVKLVCNEDIKPSTQYYIEIYKIGLFSKRWITYKEMSLTPDSCYKITWLTKNLSEAKHKLKLLRGEIETIETEVIDE
jgi:hypothetical protein